MHMDKISVTTYNIRICYLICFIIMKFVEAAYYAWIIVHSHPYIFIGISTGHTSIYISISKYLK